MSNTAENTRDVMTKIKMRRIPMTSREMELVEMLCEANNQIDDIVLGLYDEDEVSQKSIKQVKNSMKDLRKKMNCTISEEAGVYRIEYK